MIAYHQNCCQKAKAIQCGIGSRNHAEHPQLVTMKPPQLSPEDLATAFWKQYRGFLSRTRNIGYMYTPPVRQLYRLVSITEKFYIFPPGKARSPPSAGHGGLPHSENAKGSSAIPVRISLLSAIPLNETVLYCQSPEDPTLTRIGKIRAEEINFLRRTSQINGQPCLMLTAPRRRNIFLRKSYSMILQSLVPNMLLLRPTPPAGNGYDLFLTRPLPECRRRGTLRPCDPTGSLDAERLWE